MFPEAQARRRDGLKGLEREAAPSQATRQRSPCPCSSGWRLRCGRCGPSQGAMAAVCPAGGH
eukprot:3329167-Pleurochrysis_carterae.AAC.1